MPITETATDAPRAMVVGESLPQAHPIERKANAILHASSFSELRRVTCAFHDGLLILHGIVRSFYMKQVAQETLRNLDGVVHIANAVRVVDEVSSRAK